MEIKRDDPARRKSFRARHNCSDPTQIQSKVLELFSMESISKGGQLMKNFKEFITEKVFQIIPNFGRGQNHLQNRSLMFILQLMQTDGLQNGISPKVELGGLE